ncbi:MAG: histidinol phosphate phosphatase [Cyanobacteria bacterium REEB67]|nr:histidinol phosphate phosphatase [Cyanobacteria bacterium REEB67]
MASQYAEELEFALSISKEMAAVSFDYFQKGVDVVTKDDGSPVTKADKEVEALIREALAKHFPHDSILGEEEGVSAGDSAPNGRKWIIDPIDGTYNFARGIKIWSTLLALEVQSQVVLGVVSAPAMDEHFHAAAGGGAFKNGKRIHVSRNDKIEQSLFNFGGPNRIEAKGLWPNLQEVVRCTERQRGFGDYLGFSLVFEGKAEAMLEVDVKPWDLAPMKIIVEEAGGCFIDLSGGSSIYTGSCLVTNGLLMEEFKRIFIK